jgi:release factor glutamine methyltransferase
MEQALVPTDFQQPALLRLARMLRDTGYHFITITPASHARVNSRPQNREGRGVEDVFGWSRPFRPDVLQFELLGLMRDARILAEHEDGWRSLIRFSSLDGELFVHSAFPTVARDAVFFGPDTYKFVAAIKAYLATRQRPVERAVDICSGAGPGAIAIAKAARDAEVVMVDINETALQFAQVNAMLAGLRNVTPRRSDMLGSVDGAFDLIVAHPPYLVDRDARAYRHGGGALGADLSLAVVRTAMERLAPGGTLVLFTGVAMLDGCDPFRNEITATLDEADVCWSYREVDPDVFGEELAHPPYDQADRIALVVLTATRKS